MHCFFLQIAHESVAILGEEQITHKVQIVEYTLSESDCQLKQSFGLFEFQEDKQMRPLILCFFQQRVDVPIVRFQST